MLGSLTNHEADWHDDFSNGVEIKTMRKVGAIEKSTWNDKRTTENKNYIVIATVSISL